MTTKRKHKFACLEAHITTVTIVTAFIVMLSLTKSFTDDITAILLFPALFIGVIIRCVWDWIFAVGAIIYALFITAKQNIFRGEAK